MAIVSASAILGGLPGGEAYEYNDAVEIVEGWEARVRAASGGTLVDEPYARSVVRKGAKAEIWGEILRNSGHLAADETTKEEDRAEKLLKEYDAAKAETTETNQRITSRPMLRG